MIPSYIEYYTIQKALEGALADSNDLSRGQHPPRDGSTLAADYVDAVDGEGRRSHQERQHHHRFGELAEEAAAGQQREPAAGVRRVGFAIARRPGNG